MQTALKQDSTKKIEAEIDAAESSIIDELLANAFVKGDPDICMRCKCDVVNIARITDTHSLNAICTDCLVVESLMEFSDPGGEAWIPFSDDARIYDKNGRDITDSVSKMVKSELLQIHIKFYKLLEGGAIVPALSAPGPVSEDRMMELSSILAAIDMALDLGYREDFMDLTEKYRKLLQEDELSGF